MLRHVKNSSPSSNKTTQGQDVAFRQIANMKSESFLLDIGASLHMMNKSEDQKNNDFDDFVTMMLLEDSPAALSLGFLCEGKSLAYEWKEEESPSLIKDGKVTKCWSQTHVPFWDNF